MLKALAPSPKIPARDDAMGSRVTQFAELARDVYTEAGEGFAKELDEVSTWLRAHTRALVEKE